MTDIGHSKYKDNTYLDFIKSIEIDKTKTNEKLKTIINGFKDDKIKDKLLVTFGLASLIKLSQQIDMISLLNLENYMMNNNWHLLLNASKLNPIMLGVAPTVTSRVLITLMTKVIKPLEEEFEGEFGKKKAKKLEKTLTFFLGFANGLMINQGITNGGLLIALMLGVGSLLVGKVADVITEKNIADGPTTLMATDILTSIPSNEALSFAVGTFAMEKMQGAYTKEKVINHRGKNDNKYIPIKLFNNGTMPIVIASSILAVFGAFIPILANTVVFAFTQGLLILISNILMSKFISTKQITKNLKMDTQAIENVHLNNTEKYLDKKVMYSSITSGLILASLSVIPIIFGVSINLIGMVIVGELLYKIYKSISVANLNYKSFLK